jgi:GntR family transcriptional regulator
VTASIGQPDANTGADDIVEHFVGLIAAGILAPGERLPSVRQLARDLRVAPGTVAKAFQRLDAAGVVVTRHGSGTRVAEGRDSLPAAVLTALRTAIGEADRHAVDIERLRAALDAMWAATR